MGDAELLVLELAARQRGVVTIRQAQALGMTRDQVRHRRRTGRWVAVDDGVYLIAGQPLTWETRLFAHCIDGRGVTAFKSAAAWWDAPGGDRTFPAITTLRHRRRTSPEVEWHESYLLDERTDVVERDGLPVTTPARTVLDLAAVVEIEVVEAALDHFESRNLTSQSHLLHLLGRRNMIRRPGAEAVQALLDRRLAEARRPMSHYETRLRQLIREAGLPEPVAQFRLEDARGLIGYADFAFAPEQIAMEMQSYAWHATRPSLIRDSRRFARISAIGWRPLPIVTTDLDRHPELVVELIRDALAAVRL